MATTNPIVFFDITVGGVAAGRIQMVQIDYIHFSVQC